jgi:class 3 adenylate cyclase
MKAHAAPRRLTVILHADVQGYSRRIEADEVATLRILTPYLRMMTERVRQHGGHPIGSRGDSLLAEFPNVRSAVQAQARKLAAIMFTDMAGFSRHGGADEARALHLLDTHNAVIRRAVAAFHGQVLRFIGDAFLVEFPSVVNAVQCAQQIHAQFRDYNADKAKDDQIHMRIGIHLGDIIRRDSDVFGEGANIAARLQELAEPDTICISQKVCTKR